jgi:hypothetical protein
MKILKKIANGFFYFLMHPVEVILIAIVIITLFGGTGYTLHLMSKNAKYQTLIDPRISSYTVSAEITEVTTNEMGETVLKYRVIETDTYKIHVGGVGEFSLVESELNEIQKSDLSQVGAQLTITCYHEGEQMYCKMKTQNFETENTLIKYN